MHKYFCDRCGSEIGEAKDVTFFKVIWMENASYTRHLCDDCANKATAMLYPPDDKEDTP